MELLRSYLSSRAHIVKLETELSEEKTIEYGLHQGIVMGPILFNLYVNKIFSLNNAGYADDTATIFFEANTWHELKI